MCKFLPHPGDNLLNAAPQVEERLWGEGGLWSGVRSVEFGLFVKAAVQYRWPLTLQVCLWVVGLVCVCAARARARACTCVCVYVYVYVCVFVLPEPFKSCVDNAAGLAHMHTYQTQVSARKHTVPSADGDSPVVGGLAGGGQAAPPGAVAGQDKERQVVVLCVEVHAGVDLAVHAYMPRKHMRTYMHAYIRTHIHASIHTYSH